MYNPLPGWLPAPSYPEPVVPPVSEPDASPEVQVCFSAEWLPFVLGSLQQMCQPTAWAASSPAALQDTLDRAQKLLEIFGTAGACTMLRWSTADCAIEQSTDGGVTWTAISGWSIDGVASCIQTPLIDIGGAPGTGFDGPGNPGGISTAQMACNIAAWLAVEILQGSMSSIASSLSTLATTLETADAIFKLAASFTGVGGAFFTVMGILIPAATAIGETALSTAGSSSTLRDDLICAIYSAISADGKVTPTNVAAILANINAISYATPGIVGMLHDYVMNLGYNGLNAIQSEGSLYNGNCICGGTPIPGGNVCAVFNGTNDYLTLSMLDVSPYPPPTLTVCWWGRPISSGGEGVVISSFDNTVANGEYYAYYTNYGSGFATPGGGLFAGSALEFGNSNNPVGFAAWHHIAVVWTTASNNPSAIYIDGVSQPITTGAFFGVTPPSGVHTEIGRNLVSGSLYDGKLADLRVYYSVLSGSQIAAIAAGGITGYVPEGSPFHWWAFNDGSGSTAHDYGSGADNGTWSGTGIHWTTT